MDKTTATYITVSEIPIWDSKSSQSGPRGRFASPVCWLACFGQSLTSDHTVHIVIADEKPYNIYVNDYNWVQSAEIIGITVKIDCIRRPRMSTIKDVAKRAPGVSVATVSRVINGSSRVSPATALKVRQAVAELDYSPNLLGRNLRKTRSERVLVLIPDIANPFYAGNSKRNRRCREQTRIQHHALQHRLGSGKRKRDISKC